MDRSARLVAVVGTSLLVVIGLLLADPADPGRLAGATGALVFVVALGLARVDGWLLAGGLVVAGGLQSVVYAGSAANLGWFGLCACAAWAGFALPPRMAVATGSLGVLAFAGEWLAMPHEPGWGAWASGTALSLFFSVLTRRQRALTEQLRAAQAGLADRARAEERNRIAHDLHDVIGHALTVALLHIGSARLALDDDPEEARETLADAERLTRQSLADVRAVVGLMKDPGSAAPLPGVGQIDELVDSFRRAGASVSCAVAGELSALTATEGLTVYRILQEALTNAVRHAPDAAVDIRVEVAGGRTRVQVDSAGPPAPASAGGAGVTGMRERAEAMGGMLTAGPSESGWRVEAVLPA